MFLEINATALILYMLSTIGLTNILVYGKITEGFREWFKSWTPPEITEMLECYQCTGFWSGLLIGLIVLTYNPIGIIVAGFAGSFLAEFTEVIKEYLQANSFLDFPSNETEN